MSSTEDSRWSATGVVTLDPAVGVGKFSTVMAGAANCDIEAPEGVSVGGDGPLQVARGGCEGLLPLIGAFPRFDCPTLPDQTPLPPLGGMLLGCCLMTPTSAL